MTSDEGPREAEGGPWGEHALPAGDATVAAIGPLVLSMLEREGEVWLAHRYVEPGDGAPAEPEAEEWRRWATPTPGRSLRLSPVFPDRPVVVQPEVPFRLLAGARARIYVRVPLWVRVDLADVGTLTEIPTVVLSDTWFGTFTEGELCYWLPTTARRHVTPDLFEPHRAIAPLQLENRSAEDLDVVKIALRVAHLSIFQAGGDRLWSDVTRVRYRGEDEGSDLRMARKAPDEEPEATLLTSPRLVVPRGLRTRTFTRLRALSGLGSGP